MPVLFLDPVAGNDANDGLTFATRKRTINSVSTAAAALDTVRVIASPDPVSIGAATWTDNSKVIAFANPANLKVDGCDSGWVASTNVTLSHPIGASGLGLTGTSYVSIAPVAAFTTGKMAYKTLPAPLVLSAFQQLAVFFYSSGSGTFTFTVKLCSDTLGDFPVASLSKAMVHPVDFITSTWAQVILDYGADFPATPINSIAVYLDVDAGATTVLFDDFVCCKGYGDAGRIDFESLIGKKTTGEPEWYTVADLSENGVSLSGSPTMKGTDVRPYRGVSETVTTYILNPLKLGPWTTTDATIKKNVVFDGGWDRTDMSTRTGETWLSGGRRFYGFVNSGTVGAGADIKNIGLSLCIFGVSNIPVSYEDRYPDIDLLGCISCQTVATFTVSYDPDLYFKFRCKQIWAPYNSVRTPSNPVGEFHVGRIHGCFYQSSMQSAFKPNYTSTDRQLFFCKVDKIDNNYYGFELEPSRPFIKLTGTVFENNTENLRAINLNVPAKLHFDNINFDVMTYIDVNGDLQASQFAGFLDNIDSEVIQTRIAGDPTQARTVFDGQLFFERSQTIRHTPSGYSWRFWCPAWCGVARFNKVSALPIPLAQVAVEADKMVTITCWLYVENSVFFDGNGDPSLIPQATFGVMIKEEIAMGLGIIQEDADMTIFGAWQQVSLTFTPTFEGVVQVCAYAYGTNSSIGTPNFISTYYDDLVVTQET